MGLWQSVSAYAGVDGGELMLLAAIALLAGAVRGYAGFGLSAVAISLGALFVEPLRLVPVLYLLEVAASLGMLPAARRGIDLGLLAALLAGGALGMPLGQIMLLNLPADGARLTLYALVLLATLGAYRGYRQSVALSPVPALALGLAAGLASGLAAIGGLVAMVALLGVRYDAFRARATMIAMQFVMHGYACVVSDLRGVATTTSYRLSLLLLAPLFVGIFIGQRGFGRSSAEAFRRHVLLVLAVLAALGLCRTVFAQYGVPAA